MDEIAAGLDELVPWNDPIETELEHSLYKNRHPEFHPEQFHEQHTPVEIQGYHPGELASYNELVGGTL